MGLNAHQLAAIIIKPALVNIGYWSEAAEELLLGTAIQESNLTFLHQQGGGHAVGLWQMEPATHDDIWKNYLASKVKLGLSILGNYHIPDANRAAYDLRYAAAMCRVHYLRVPEALPVVGDRAGQSAYWKRWYNTIHGAGTVQEYLSNWNRVMG